MSRQTPFNGLVVATITPMSDDGERVDLAAATALAEWLVERGVDGLFVAGTTGEAVFLSDDERVALTQALVRGVKGRIPVAVQVTTATTQGTQEALRAVAEVGVDAVACVTPWYYRLDEPALRGFYRAVASAAGDMPVYLYNIPARTGNRISAALARELAMAFENVAGIKDSSGDMRSLLDLLEVREALAAARAFAVLAGSDTLSLAFMRAGGDGVVSGTASVVPEPFVELFRAIRQGDRAGQSRWYAVVRRVAALLGEGDRLDLFKAVAQDRGLGGGSVRLPLTQCSRSEAAPVIERLRAIWADEGWTWRW
ncbi:dihydrodipicolinate synthase family protein [Carboxydochorda subterranea]|uniref:Dihydrodipicolinate synthase family protein n=1 Tax=Carboxydichorda subterranea TaxID=3109565 RepID=A0ABZ1BWT9_9FIRM|nr:dihydrodipicolinate synthase family protein [Limnochorda sp. L945t]WRP17277.1 dihydrodipicolinate synthase family protein [Limnochorda sp. L945t]